MELTPAFSAFAHGVKHVHEGYMTIFKIIATPYEFHDPAHANDTVNEGEWKRFIQKVNDQRFAYSFASGKLTITVSKSANAGNMSGTPVKFPTNIEEELSEPVKITDNFVFGSKILTQAETLNPAMDSAFNNGWTKRKGQKADLGINPTRAHFAVPSSGNTGITQLHHVDGDEGLSAGNIRKNIGDNLKTTKNYSVTQQTGSLDFKNIYTSIINEPFIAERHFGLIRELRIPVETFATTDTDFSYGITVAGNPDANDHYVADRYRFKRQGGKYYNGLSKSFFTDADFLSIRISFWDLYKHALEDDGSPHPDGLYVNVFYKNNTAGSGLSDPFVTDDGSIKGYNAVIRTNRLGKPTLFSLSWHKATYTFPHSNDNYPDFFTSGFLNPRAEIVTDQGNARNNVLMAWRGDNLAVNRPVREKQKGDGMTVKTSMVTGNTCDNNYIRDNMFIKTESLAPASQAQLLAGARYHILLRTVGPTEHCLPLTSELKNDRQKLYTWTVEDELKTDDAFNTSAICGGSVVYDVKVPGGIPIKKVSIIGSKKYDDNNSGLVDNGNHIVLDEINGEHSEKRFIYPPAIKIEDLKFLGYLDRDKLRTKEEALRNRTITIGEYAHRFHRIEHRLKNDAPRLACWRTHINYLPDPRGTQLIFFPADLATLNRLTLVQHDPLHNVFRYSDHYPFFNEAHSLKFNVGEDRKGNYRMMLDDDLLYRNVRQGIYKFWVYVADESCDNNAPNLGVYNYNELQVSILDKPEAPKAFNELMSVIRLNDDKIANYWFSYFDLIETSTWKSIKYREETKMLKLDLHKPEKRYHELKRKHLPEYELMEGEFPYEVFLTDDGDITQEANLRTTVYPSLVELYIKADPALNISAGQFFSLRLNDKDTLIAYITPTGLNLQLNGNSIATGVKIELSIAFKPSANQFQIEVGGLTTPLPNPIPAPVPIPNLIKQDLSLNDIEVATNILWQLQYRPNEAFIRFTNKGKYVFISNLQHAHSALKTVKLYGSSPYQGYFPRASSEFDLGTDGSTHYLFIPNNTKPTKPIIDTDVLLMYTKEESWRELFGSTSKQTTCQQLIRLTLSADFMTEGKNKLGIVISGDPKYISMVGDDITKLSGADFSKYSFRDLLPEPEDMRAVFSKYIDCVPYCSFSIDNITYEVLQCVPFYNTTLQKWQVILPLKHFSKAEALFLKLVALKISPGYGLQGGDDQTVFTDTTGTNLSVFTDPLMFPIYNSRSFQVTRFDQYYHLHYEGPSVRKKAFFVMYTKACQDISLLEPKESFGTEFVSFDTWQSTRQVSTDDPTKKILLFTGTDIEICKVDGYSILVLEFEVFDNIHEPLKSDILKGQCFVQYSPLFGAIQGVRLINIVEFVI